MPILWRYLIRSYLQVFLLSLVAFVAILLTSRLEEIAHFASFGAEGKLILLFALFQIPYILPIAIPVSCLIASILLMQRLSMDQELTAIRSSGFSLKAIIAPLLYTSIFLALFNFYTVSELATLGHLKANLLKNELRSINPLLLLHNKQLVRAKGFYYDALGSSKMGQSASQLFIALPNEKRTSLNLALIDHLETAEGRLDAKQLTLITPFGEKQALDNVLIETLNSSRSSLEDFANLIQKKVTKISDDNLTFSLLTLRLHDLEKERTTLDENVPRRKELQNSIRSIYAEIARRFSAGLSPIAFTLLGLAFGMSINRTRKRFSLIFPIGLAAFYLVCFFAAKALEQNLALAFALYLVPQVIIIAASLLKMRKISRGASL